MFLSQDTFSFALVLLCLAVGDIAFVRNRGRAITRTAYASGFRYSLPKSLRTACPEVAALIREMWDDDFRKRPALRDVVVRLGATSTAALDGGGDEETAGSEDDGGAFQPPGGDTVDDAGTEVESAATALVRGELERTRDLLAEKGCELAKRDARIRELVAENAELKK